MSATLTPHLKLKGGPKVKGSDFGEKHMNRLGGLEFVGVNNNILRWGVAAKHLDFGEAFRRGVAQRDTRCLFSWCKR